MKTAGDRRDSIIKKYSEEIQHCLDERNNLISDALKSIYEYLQDFTAEMNETISEKQGRLNTRLKSLFEEIGCLEGGIDEIEEFLGKISSEITKFIECGREEPLSK